MANKTATSPHFDHKPSATDSGLLGATGQTPLRHRLRPVPLAPQPM